MPVLEDLGLIKYRPPMDQVLYKCFQFFKKKTFDVVVLIYEQIFFIFAPLWGAASAFCNNFVAVFWTWVVFTKVLSEWSKIVFYFKQWVIEITFYRSVLPPPCSSCKIRVRVPWDKNYLLCRFKFHSVVLVSSERYSIGKHSRGEKVASASVSVR